LALLGDGEHARERRVMRGLADSSDAVIGLHGADPGWWQRVITTKTLSGN
jgi:hypothetical protein